MSRDSISLSLTKVLYPKQSKPLVQTRRVMRLVFILLVIGVIVLFALI